VGKEEIRLALLAQWVGYLKMAVLNVFNVVVVRTVMLLAQLVNIVFPVNTVL
jgi:hypothetical protein